MTLQRLRQPMAVAAIVALFALPLTSGCERSTDDAVPAPGDDNPNVYIDGFEAGMYYDAFANTKFDAFQQAEMDRNGIVSTVMEITVPPAGHPTEWFAGGAFATSRPRDFRDYDALTFWARSSVDGAVVDVGMGIDIQRDRTENQITLAGLQLDGTWRKFVVPLANPARLDATTGLFWFSAGSTPSGPDGGAGYQFWIDDIQYEKLGAITDPRPTLTASPTEFDQGEIVTGNEIPVDLAITFAVNGTDVTISASPRYLDFISSDESVARGGAGQIEIVGAGTTTIVATLAGTPAVGGLQVTASPSPTEPAPNPTDLPADVISIYSDTYGLWPVERYRADWSNPPTIQQKEVVIANNAALRYTGIGKNGFGYTAIEFLDNRIDASEMTHVHFDVWLYDTTNFGFKVVNIPQGSPFTEGVKAYAGASALPTEQWVSLDVPLSELVGPSQDWSSVAQIVIQGDANKVYVDNLYFHK